MQMLKDGGTLAIVLPETYFHAPSKRHVLEYLLRDNNIRAVVDLPHNTFRPHNNAKTILVIVQKGTKQQEKITMAVIEGIGHDHQGRPLYRYDRRQQKTTTEVWDDSPAVRREMRSPESSSNKYVFTVKASDIRESIYVPRYYRQADIAKIEREAAAKKRRLVKLSEIIEKDIVKAYDGHGSPGSAHKGEGSVPYIRVSDIVNWDIYKNYTAMIPEAEYERIKARGIDLRPRDVLFVRRGSYRIGTVALLTDCDLNLLLTREIKIFRVVEINNEFGISPEYLLYLLSHDLVQRQLKNLVLYDTTLPNIGDRWEELRLPLHEDDAERNAVTSRMKSIFDKKRAMLREMRKMDEDHGPLTT